MLEIAVKSVLISFLLVGVKSQSQELDFKKTVSAVHDIKKDVEIHLKNTTFQNPNDIPQIKDWKAKCEQEHGAEVIKEVEDAPGELVHCVLQYVKPDKLQIEVNRSMARGNLDRVFKKYCGYRNKILSCVDVMLDKFRVCMTPQQLKDVNVTRRAIDAAIHFTCHDDGDRIALFMAEQGVECIKEHQKDIQTCIQLRVPEINMTIEDTDSLNLDSVVINEEQCSKLHSIHQCIVRETTKCSDATPSNILDSLIKQMLNVTPCAATNTMQAAEQTTSGATASGCNVGSLVKQAFANVGPIIAGGVGGGGLLGAVGGVADLMGTFELGLGPAVAYTAMLTVSFFTACYAFVLYAAFNIWNHGTSLLNATISFITNLFVGFDSPSKSSTVFAAFLTRGCTALQQTWLWLCGGGVCATSILIVLLSALTATNLLL